MPAGSRPHDVAPARDGVWYTAQGSGELGWLDPRTGRVREVPLGPRSAPHGVIVGPDGAPWITDGGLNAIVRVEPRTRRVRRFSRPAAVRTRISTPPRSTGAVSSGSRPEGLIGRLDPKVGRVRVFSAPLGERARMGSHHSAWSGLLRVARRELRGAGSTRAAARITDLQLGGGDRARAALFGLPRPDLDQRVDRGQAGCLRPGPAPPGASGRCLAQTRSRTRSMSTTATSSGSATSARTRSSGSIRAPGGSRRSGSSSPANVRQLLGRPGELWGAESGVDKLVVVRPR